MAPKRRLANVGTANYVGQDPGTDIELGCSGFENGMEMAVAHPTSHSIRKPERQLGSDASFTRELKQNC